MTSVSVPMIAPVSSSRATSTVWLATVSASCSSVGGVRASVSCGISRWIASTSSSVASCTCSILIAAASTCAGP